MKLTPTQLRRIIKEEVRKALLEGNDNYGIDPEDARRLDDYVAASTYHAGFVGVDYPDKPRLGGLNMQELMSPRFLGRRPRPEDLQALNLAWEAGRKKWGRK